MKTRGTISRRGFLGKTAAAGLAARFLPAGARGAPGRAGPNERIGIGLIGCGGMGRGNLKNCAKHPDAVIAAVCDVWKERREKARAEHDNRPKAYHDYRELLAAEDVDAVIIATPPHWHALQAIDACRAGKDIYLQKPMTLHLAESNALANAVDRHGIVTQIGTQIHAGGNYRRVVERIRAGHLGPIGVVRTFNVMNQGAKGVGHDPNTTPPPGLDWDFWLGPGPARPFNAILARDSYHHCSFMDYSGGWTPGMAPHIIDLPVWALDLGYPTRVHCSGGRYIIQDDGDAPDIQEILWQYPKRTMTWMMSLVNSYGFDLEGEPVPRRRLGIYFHGLNGTLYANYDKHEIVPEGDGMKGKEAPMPTIPPSPGHEWEWIDCVKMRQEPSCSVAYHHRIDVPIVLANLALRLGRAIRFDPKSLSIVGDAEAARLAKPTYREPWKFPEEYL